MINDIFMYISGNTTLSTRNLQLFRICVRSFRQNNRNKFKDKTKNIRLTPVEDVAVSESRITSSGSLLVRPFLFTAAFSTASFAGAAIWQYETMRAHVIKAKESLNPRQYGDFGKAWKSRQSLSDKWNEMLRRWTPGQRMIYTIIGANVLVFGMWRLAAIVPKFSGVMTSLFLSSPYGRAPCLSMVLSTFSQISFVHMFCNMFALKGFGEGVVESLGKEQTLALYLSTGVVAGFADYVHKVVTKTRVPSIGASGAVLGLVAAVACLRPKAELSIIGVDYIIPHSFYAENVLIGVMVFDALGLLLGWRLFAHGAHLGGVLYGIWYIKYGNKLIWTKRDKFIQYWHSVRGSI